jgi:hypothetical protein
MNFSQWLKRVKETYRVDVSEEKGDNHFIAITLSFIDPQGRGIPFQITLDDTGVPSTFSAGPFQFAWFNQAEGASAEDILSAGDQCLAGDLNIKREFFGNKRMLVFDLPSFKGKSNKVSVEQAKIQGYLTGYRRLRDEANQ